MPPPKGAITIVPGIPNSPDLYTTVHLDRVEKFSITKEEVISPNLIDNRHHDGWRHELEHDAESVFWLLYWAMVVQPGGCPKEKIKASSWSLLNGNYNKREALIRDLRQSESDDITHLFYKHLLPLFEDLIAFLIIDNHWFPDSDPRKDPSYITEAFQRLILQFIIKNRDEEFMHRPVEDTFRKVRAMQPVNGWSSTLLQSLDAAK